MSAVLLPASVRNLASSAVAVSCPADTSEDTLATITVPAMSINGILRIFTLWSMTGSTNNKIPRVKLGGTAFFASTVATGTVVGLMDERWIMNRGATNSQVGFQSGTLGQATSAAANTTGAIDTSVPTTLLITGQKASAGETLTLDAYLVELITP